jgi:hypothetical protein
VPINNRSVVLVAGVVVVVLGFLNHTSIKSWFPRRLAASSPDVTIVDASYYYLTLDRVGDVSLSTIDATAEWDVVDSKGLRHRSFGAIISWTLPAERRSVAFDARRSPSGRHVIASQTATGRSLRIRMWQS